MFSIQNLLMLFKISIYFQPFLLVSSLLIIAPAVQAQTRSIEPLNRHFINIAPEDSVNIAFLKISTELSDNLKIIRYYDLSNRIIKKETIGYNPDGGYREKTVQEYDSLGDLVSLHIQNLENQLSITTYYFDGKQVAQLIYEGNGNYSVIRNGENSPQQLEKNNFTPQLNASKEEWGKFFNRNFKVNGMRIKEDSQYALIAVLIDENGNRKEIEVANPHQVEDYFEQKALELILKWGDNYLPALDPFGNPIEKWLYIPLQFIR